MRGMGAEEFIAVTNLCLLAGLIVGTILYWIFK